MTQEALKLALDALENHTAIKHPQQIHYRDKAITAIKEALAQEQEPVAVVDVHEFYDNCANFSLLQKLPKGKHTLYNIPPQRTWVGLTDEQIAEIENEYIVDYRIPAGSAWNFAKDIEAKLKEKNT